MWTRLALLLIAVGSPIAASVAADAASAVLALESPQWEVLPPLPYPSIDASDPEGALERLRQDGVVLLRSRPTFLEARHVLDDVMSRMGLERNAMCTNGTSGRSLNPNNISSSISPLRIGFTDNHILAPADRTAQGPHQEGLMASRNNRRVLAFYCEEPSEEGGETALFDMQRAWEMLPADLRARFRRSHFGHVHARTGRAEKVPAVVLHPQSGAPCLQFYCFGRAARDCIDFYRAKSGRYHTIVDPYTYEMSVEKDMLLTSEDNKTTPFIGLDLYRTLSSIYDSMFAHRWRKGDIVLVDNVRFAHARLDGFGENRSIRFLHYGPADRSFHLNKLKRP